MIKPDFRTLGVKATKRLEAMVTEIYRIFSFLYENSNDFKASVDGPFIRKIANVEIESGFYPLAKILPDNPTSFSEDFRLLRELRNELWLIYDMEPFLINQESGTELVITHQDPTVANYRIKGKTISLINRTFFPLHNEPPKSVVGHAKRMWFDEINIKDSNDFDLYDKGLSGLFEYIRSQTPSIIKYTSKRGRKHLLVSIPEYFDPSIFLKNYRPIIRKLHADFYQTQFKGRTRSKAQKAYRIWKILEDKYGHWEHKEKLTNDQMSKEVSELLTKQGDKHASFQNIRRNYKFLFKEFREAKNR